MTLLINVMLNRSLHRNKIMLLSVISIILAAVFFAWQYYQRILVEGPYIEKGPVQIDYFIDQFSAKIYTAQGKINYILDGEKLIHYQDTDNVNIKQPLLKIEDKNRWQISSDVAVSAENLTGQIAFQHNAKIIKQDDTDFFVKAENFIFNTDNKTFTAEDNKNPIEIIWASGKITGSNMLVNFNDETFQLNEVYATYAN